MAVLEKEMAITDPFPTESCAKRALQRLGLALARRPEGGSSSEACADPPGIGVCRCGAGALLEPVVEGGEPVAPVPLAEPDGPRPGACLAQPPERDRRQAAVCRRRLLAQHAAAIVIVDVETHPDLSRKCWMGQDIYLTGRRPQSETSKTIGNLVSDLAVRLK